MATSGNNNVNNNAGKPVDNSTQTQANNQQNQANQGGQNQAHDVQAINQSLHHAVQAGVAPAGTPAIAASIPAHGVMYAANSVGDAPAQINGDIVLAQNTSS